MDRRGQMHVLETVLVAVLFTSAMNVAIGVLPTTANDVQQTLQLELLGRDTLVLADTLVPDNASLAETYDNSTLKMWLFSPNLMALGSFLNDTLPANVAYTLSWLDPQGNIAGSLNHSLPTGDVVGVLRFLYHNGLYQVQLQLWYGLRGVV